MMGGGGGPSDFLGLKFWPKVIFFESMKCGGIFLGREKKEEFFGLLKRTKGFFGVC